MSTHVKTVGDKMSERNKETKHFTIDPMSMKGAADEFGGSDFPNWEPIATPEQEAAIQDLFQRVSNLNNSSAPLASDTGLGFTDGFDAKAPWIQTFSGRRFNPTQPDYRSIVIQDIAHALSMQCRFSGHCRYFYSVAQHSVLVSHICDQGDALWGLMHDASEAYLVDVPRPLKQSGKFQAYLDFEEKMQEAVCQRFGLSIKEPPSVKVADKALLATEARDLMAPLHPDWRQPVDPLPFRIEPWDPARAKVEFMDRFSKLTKF